VNEGSALAPGALIATLELDDPTKVKRAETFTGKPTKAGNFWFLSAPTYCNRPVAMLRG